MPQGSRIIVLLLQGKLDAALIELDQEDQENPQNVVDRVLVYDALGRKSEADRLLASVEMAHPEQNAYDIACVYALRGDVKNASRGCAARTGTRTLPFGSPALTQILRKSAVIHDSKHYGPN